MDTAVIITTLLPIQIMLEIPVGTTVDTSKDILFRFLFHHSIFSWTVHQKVPINHQHLRVELMILMPKSVFPMPKPSQVINFLIKIPTYVCERRIRMKSHPRIHSDQIWCYFVFTSNACIPPQLNTSKFPTKCLFFMFFLTISSLTNTILIVCTCSSKSNFYIIATVCNFRT